MQYAQRNRLSVRLGDTLQLVLLLDGIRVAATLGGVDQLFSQALSNALDVAESGLTGTNGEKGDSLVDTAQRRHIDGLTTDSTSGTDTGGVFARTAVDDGVDGDLDGVLVRHDVDDLESVSDDCANALVPSCRLISILLRKVRTAHSHELLAVVATVHHERVGETLDLCHCQYTNAYLRHLFLSERTIGH